MERVEQTDAADTTRRDEVWWRRYAKVIGVADGVRSWVPGNVDVYLELGLEEMEAFANAADTDGYRTIWRQCDGNFTSFLSQSCCQTLLPNVGFFRQ